MSDAEVRACGLRVPAQQSTAMVPIPVSLDDETKNLIDGLQRRQKDLAEFQVPRLHQCKGALAEQERLAAELKEDLDVFGRQVDVSELSFRTTQFSLPCERRFSLEQMTTRKERTERLCCRW